MCEYARSMCMQQHVLCTLCVFGGAHHLIIAFLWSFAIELFYSCSFELLHCQLYIWFDWYLWLNFNRNTQYFTTEAPILQISENQLPFQFKMHNRTATTFQLMHAYGVLESIRYDMESQIIAKGTGCFQTNWIQSLYLF